MAESTKDSAVYVGTTNTDGTGTSANLTEENATNVQTGEGQVNTDGVIISELDLESDASSAFTSIEEWNAEGYKEVSIDSDAEAVIVDNFVDVDINNGADGSYILVNDAKRGQITTADGDDEISIDVYSNNEGWVNAFTINSNAGDDSVVMADSQNSQLTSVAVHAGTGDDLVDLSHLNGPDNSIIDVTRSVDGGEGNDTLVFSGENSVAFTNVEVVQGAESTLLTLTDSVLAGNHSADSGLVLTNIDVSFGDSVSYEVEEMSDEQSAYLESLELSSDEFTALTVTTDDGSYDILTDDVIC